MVIVGVLSFLIRMFIVQPFYIIGSSMEPNLQEGQILLIDELTFRFAEPRRGDIIILHPPRDTRDYIKRVIGLPGEKISIDEAGEVLINGHAIYEPYLAGDNKVTKGTLQITLGSDDYFVLGDNRQVSNDSRGGVNPSNNTAENPWTIHKKDIVGKAFLRWWPFDALKFFSSPAYTL
ncbi:signal peptidase I [Candidatus Wirthbacteria bacterium CG2_30_54_11]|uniref:Signal peptidase I n=1 Tax=Candidatus Wirthbacteria bacterium CG2_30_54_11 TaxID=1817892 RepID=A0A1J5IQK2_9BACT|nr:MAG: signal peptidase I [Candidatus Wirthbacteria bacterium CG2_30_54_11]